MYKDVLTFVSIRYYDRPYYVECFPSYETIAERMNSCKQFVMESISRLEKADYIKVVKSGLFRIGNRYTFTEAISFTKIPDELLKPDIDLSINEKAILICLRQYYEVLSGPKNINGIARTFGITYKTVHKQYQSLLDKGYLEETPIEYGKKKSKKVSLTDKINWQLKPKVYDLIADNGKLIVT